jgi:uncharacterized protein
VVAPTSPPTHTWGVATDPELVPPPTVLSVRGEAHRTVEPDQVTLHGQLNVLRPGGPEALNAASVAVETMLAGLIGLGGVALDSTTGRAPLTWLVRRVHTTPEWGPDNALTGNVYASVQMQIGVRDFTLLDRVQAVTADPNLYQINFPQWQLDPDNAAWPAVRAQAVGDAVRRAREYAAALGSELFYLEHLADAGLLARDSGGARPAARLAAMTSGGPTGPSLDPVPQELVATVEARFRVSPVYLARLQALE